MSRIYLFFHTAQYGFLRLVGILRTKWRMWGNGVQYSNCRTVGVPYIAVSGGGKIILGKNFQMNNEMEANQIGYSTPCVLRAHGGTILIGDNVGMSQSALVASGANITIGDYVKLGGGVKIYTTDFHSLDFQKRREPIIDMAERKYASVTIENDCFIGAGTTILKGVHIGARTIIGAGSIITNDIPCDCIAAGNPCRVIRMINKQ